jgi:ATP-dependent Clp protease ATP-binding subunit ClpC
VLAEAEYLDRFEAALRTARKLGDRLQQRRGGNGRASSELAGLLASRLYVLDSALAGLAREIPPDVFLRIRPIAGSDSTEAGAFTSTLSSMYVAWGERRGMRLRRLPTGDEHEHVLAVSGLGAGAILAAEAGVHVLEVVGDGEQHERTAERVAAAIEVAAWRPEAGFQDTPLAAHAEKALANAPVPTQVVRRYRSDPSPLVRDAVRRYRTGRLDRVLAGDFDVF